jgi:hypothetical protein
VIVSDPVISNTVAVLGRHALARALRANQVTTRPYPTGFGEHALKDVGNLRAGENRRVTFLRLPADASGVLLAANAVCGN